MTNLMQHSTGVLDISDDESKSSPSDGRGKENVPPSELGIDLPISRESISLAATAAARKASRMEEDRAPLGELNASDYYPEDCNAFSYVVVYDDEEDENSAEEKKAISNSPTQPDSIPSAITTSIASLLETALPPSQAAESAKVDDSVETSESSSAAENSPSATKEK